ncbi:MAG: dsrR [bacterium]|jgi:iron-sulfur cluster assembly protein|nr:MAG: dsrR [bacterium]KAF0148172.1 MAG: dsrR [bacterium]KAF0167687.1 MAG: dsrR [bacterium]TXT21104.1 MAG: dsrR [bacterium]
MISLTKEAAEQIRVAAEQSGAGNMGLRVAARVNDAGMLEFGMGFDDERSNDAAVDVWGVTLLVNAQSAPYLDDVTIDFSEVEPGHSRFVFMKASAGGCGSGGGGGGCGSGGCGSGGCGSGS